MDSIFRLTKLSLLGITLSIASSLSYASGGYGGGNTWENYNYTPRPVDKNYEIGKALYKGRSTEYGKIKWCVKTEDGYKRLSGRLLKPYKTLSSLSTALYDCRTDDRLVANYIPAEDYEYILYYLIKRYRLKIDENA